MTRDEDMSNILIGEISINGQASPAKAVKVYESAGCICLEVRIPVSGYTVAGSMGCKVFLFREGSEEVTVHVGLPEDDWILFCAEASKRTVFCVYMRENRWETA